MRITPVGPRISFWAIHWPWWRVQLRAAFYHLPGAIQRALEPAARRLLPEKCPVPPAERLEEEPPERWVPPSQPDLAPRDVEWPSDQPPPRPKKIDVRSVEEPRDRESGQLFDFLI